MNIEIPLFLSEEKERAFISAYCPSCSFTVDPFPIFIKNLKEVKVSIRQEHTRNHPRCQGKVIIKQEPASL